MQSVLLKRLLGMDDTRGWFGLLLFFIGIVMLFMEQTRIGAWVVIGFGIGMIGSGFSN